MGGVRRPGGKFPPGLLRSETARRLRDRREEIYEAVIHRAFSVAPPSGKEAPGYVEALRAAIPAAVEHAFDAIEHGEERIGPTPAAIFVQAAASARSRVGLEVVLRRYAAGYSTISDFLHQELRALGADSTRGYTVLQRELTALFDRFVAEVSEAYRREERDGLHSPARRREERIRRLLAGDLVDPAGLEYPIEGFHLAMIVFGPDPEEAASELARRLDRNLLVGEGPAGRCAAWLGGPRPLDPEQLDAGLLVTAKDGVRLSLGEPGAGLAGWRRSRRQAEAAYLVAEHNLADLVRYRDVALVAAALRDPDLSHFLSETFVEPLADERFPLVGSVLAVLEKNGNISSAAAALGLARQTVAGRIQSAEKRLGRPLGSCFAELHTALLLSELT